MIATDINNVITCITALIVCLVREMSSWSGGLYGAFSLRHIRDQTVTRLVCTL